MENLQHSKSHGDVEGSQSGRAKENANETARQMVSCDSVGNDADIEGSRCPRKDIGGRHLDSAGMPRVQKLATTRTT